MVHTRVRTAILIYVYRKTVAHDIASTSLSSPQAPQICTKRAKIGSFCEFFHEEKES